VEERILLNVDLSYVPLLNSENKKGGASKTEEELAQIAKAWDGVKVGLVLSYATINI